MAHLQIKIYLSEWPNKNLKNRIIYIYSDG